MLSRITAISMKSIGVNSDPVSIAFDYIHEDFTGIVIHCGHMDGQVIMASPGNSPTLLQAL